MNDTNNVYPLIDPKPVLSIFNKYDYFDPFASWQGRMPEVEGVPMFDEYHYMQGMRGSKINTGHTWVKNRERTDGNDYDLSITFIYLPSIKHAASGFVEELELNKKISKGSEEIDDTGTFKADDIAISKSAHFYVMDARYRNYLVKIVSNSKSDFIEFDSHFTAILGKLE